MKVTSSAMACLTLMALCALPSGGVSGDAAAAEAPRAHAVVVATRSLVVRGDGPSSVDIRFPRGTSLTATLYPRRLGGPNSDVSLEGRGTSVGIAMVRLQPGDTPDIEDVRLALGRFTGCSFGCSKSMNVNFAYPWTDRAALPAGAYRVYAWGKGDFSVRLRLASGAPGTTVVRAEGPASVHTAVPEAKFASEHLLSAGTVYPIAAGGLRLSVLALDMKDSGPASLVGTCTYEDAGQPNEVRFLPGCPEGAPATRYVIPIPSQADEFYFDDIAVVTGSGDVAFGMWHLSRSPVEQALQGTIFVEF